MKFSKISKRLAACSLAGVMMVSMLGMTAFAAEPESATGTVGAGGVSFTKTLDMSEAVGASVPDITFSYEIKPGTYKAATDTTPEILAGIEGAEIGTVAYTYEDKAATTIDKSVSVNFNKVTWPAPGIYRYIITEKATSGNDDITNDENPTRYLDVYVVNGDKIGEYRIASQALSTSDAAPTGKQYSNKSAGFTNKYKTYQLSLSKVVDGTMGEKRRTYNFKINFEGPANASFTMKNDKNEDVKVVLDGDGKGSVDIALTNGSTKDIKGIPSTVKYTVVENISKNDGYTVSYTVGGTDATSATYATSTEKTMGKGDNAVVCTNLKNAVTPTGIAMTVAPYILMVAVAGIFAVLFLRKRHEEA